MNSLEMINAETERTELIRRVLEIVGVLNYEQGGDPIRVMTTGLPFDFNNYPEGFKLKDYILAKEIEDVITKAKYGKHHVHSNHFLEMFPDVTPQNPENYPDDFTLRQYAETQEIQECLECYEFSHLMCDNWPSFDIKSI